jgi:hypothetical protein
MAEGLFLKRRQKSSWGDGLKCIGAGNAVSCQVKKHRFRCFLMRYGRSTSPDFKAFVLT